MSMNEVELLEPIAEQMGIGVRGDYVVLVFPTPSRSVVIHYDSAPDFLEKIERHSTAARLKEDVEGKYSAMAQKARGMAHMEMVRALKSAKMHSQLETEIDFERLANEMLDSVETHYTQNVLRLLLLASIPTTPNIQMN